LEPFWKAHNLGISKRLSPIGRKHYFLIGGRHLILGGLLKAIAIAIYGVVLQFDAN
jgi:hypothetical protein